MVALRDVTERIRVQQDLLHRASHDALTGLGNRMMLQHALDSVVGRTGVADGPTAVALLDLDDFKRVNDSFGHTAGDELLVTVGERLRGCVRDGDVVTRLGGDEFALVLHGAGEQEALVVTERVLDAVAVPVDIRGTEVQVGASIGVVIVPDRGGPPGDILQSADLAMYQAKTRGKGTICVFEERMAHAATGRLIVEGELRQALRSGQLRLAYQPVIDLRSGRMTGTEALVRWEHPQRGTLGPAEFIAVAEESGLIVPIGEWVLQSAVHQLVAWDEQRDHSTTTTMAVNVSIRQLDRAGFVDAVATVLEQTGIDPSRLVLEITETALGDHPAVFDNLVELHRRGVAISVDDFGTGYSSLSRLRTSPVDLVKLDRSFVSEITSIESRVPVLRATVAMAAGLGLSVVAEGIETQAQLQHLRALGCQEGQGFFIGRPVDAQAISELLVAGQPLVDPETGPASTPLNTLDAVISEAVSPATELDDVVQPLLTELRDVTGFESIYLTKIDWDELQQQITHVHNAGSLEIPEGAIVEWSETLCRRALEAGRSTVDDVAASHPDCTAAADLGIRSFATVPIEVEPGMVYGTLCAASAGEGHLTRAQLATMRLFARLVADKLRGGAARANR